MTETHRKRPPIELPDDDGHQPDSSSATMPPTLPESDQFFSKYKNTDEEPDVSARTDEGPEDPTLEEPVSAPQPDVSPPADTPIPPLPDISPGPGDLDEEVLAESRVESDPESFFQSPFTPEARKKIKDSLAALDQRAADFRETAVQILKIGSGGGALAYGVFKLAPDLLGAGLDILSKMGTVSLQEAAIAGGAGTVVAASKAAYDYLRPYVDSFRERRSMQQDLIEKLKSGSAITPEILEILYARKVDAKSRHAEPNLEAFYSFWRLIYDVQTKYQDLLEAMGTEDDSLEDYDLTDPDDVTHLQDQLQHFDNSNPNERAAYITALINFHRSWEALTEACFEGAEVNVSKALEEAGFLLNGHAVIRFPGESPLRKETPVGRLAQVFKENLSVEEMVVTLGNEEHRGERGFTNSVVTPEHQMVVLKWREKVTQMLKILTDGIEQQFQQTELQEYAQARNAAYREAIEERTGVDLSEVEDIEDDFADIAAMYHESWENTGFSYEDRGQNRIVHDVLTNWIEARGRVIDWEHHNEGFFVNIVSLVEDLIFTTNSRINSETRNRLYQEVLAPLDSLVRYLSREDGLINLDHEGYEQLQAQLVDYLKMYPDIAIQVVANILSLQREYQADIVRWRQLDPEEYSGASFRSREAIIDIITAKPLFNTENAEPAEAADQVDPEVYAIVGDELDDELGFDNDENTTTIQEYMLFVGLVQQDVDDARFITNIRARSGFDNPAWPYDEVLHDMDALHTEAEQLVEKIYEATGETVYPGDILDALNEVQDQVFATQEQDQQQAAETMAALKKQVVEVHEQELADAA